MRLSSDERDPGYSAWARGMAARPDNSTTHVRVYLRDALVVDVVTADDEEGMLVRYRRDAAGDLIVENGAIPTEVLRGEVRIEYPAWWSKD